MTSSARKCAGVPLAIPNFMSGELKSEKPVMTFSDTLVQPGISISISPITSMQTILRMFNRI